VISAEEALAIIKTQAVLLGTEKVGLEHCLGRVLRQDVVCDVDMPPFDRSSMDGFACRREDLRGELEVVETIAAGSRPSHSLGRGQCAKIMTGAMVPEGADCVVIVEESQLLPDGRMRWQGRDTPEHICRRGADIAAGQRLLESGTRICAKTVASLALAGCVQPLVSRRPRVGVIATGDEVVSPQAAPGPAQIRDSNSAQLMAQAAQCGCAAVHHGIVKDRKADIGAALSRAQAASDVILIAGGVSMGDFDLVPAALREQGFELLFEKVAVQPGKPTVFGRRGGVFVFGVPGNPVSAFMSFEFFVQELLDAMTGLRARAPALRLPWAGTFKRTRADRLARVPVRLRPDGTVEAVEFHGSAHVSSLAGADGIVSIPVGVSEIPGGTAVDVRPI
jgi:molybdopterin molybdotransferase